MRQATPVRSFPANGFGLFDILGSVSEWTQDCYHAGYEGAPADGSAWTVGECQRRMIRGGAWDSSPWRVRSAARAGSNINNRVFGQGFRVSRIH